MRRRRLSWPLGAAACLLPCAVVLAGLKVDVWPRDLAPGTPFRIHVADEGSAGRMRGTFLGHDLPFVHRKDGWIAFAGVDLDVAPGTYRLQVVRDGETQEETVEAAIDLVVAAREYPVERLHVSPRYVEPPVKVARRIQREAAALKSIWEDWTPQFLWGERLVRPLEGVKGRNFGRRRVFNARRKSPHSGTDLAAPAGTPVPAAAAGRVVLAENQYYSGNLVVLDHGGGIYTLYAHLSRIDVATGETVQAGDPLGLVGATGRVTGPHLHWGAHLGPARVDPQALLDLLRRWAGAAAPAAPTGRAQAPIQRRP